MSSIASRFTPWPGSFASCLRSCSSGATCVRVLSCQVVLVHMLLRLRYCSSDATCIAVLPCQADSHKIKKFHILWRLCRYHWNTMSSWLPSEAGNTSQASARLRYVNSTSRVSCQSRTAKWLNCVPSTFLQLLSSTWISAHLLKF
jgi:hypothetical protein